MIFRRKTILIVEDDDGLGKLYATALTSDGFRVKHVRDGLDALHSVEQHVPDLILLDIGLPRLDGRSVMQEIRSRPDTRRIPILIVTGLPDSFAELSGESIFRKPVDVQQLVAAVHHACAKRPKSRGFGFGRLSGV